MNLIYIKPAPYKGAGLLKYNLKANHNIHNVSRTEHYGLLKYNLKANHNTPS